MHSAEAQINLASALIFTTFAGESSGTDATRVFLLLPRGFVRDRFNINIMKFDELDLHEDVMQGLEAMNFKEMTPVQEQTIPIILEGKDIIGCAQTGTGKTAAYSLPLLDRLVREGNPDNVVRAVIMVPTRELAQQIGMQFDGFGYFLPVSTAVIYGGGDGPGWEQQKRALQLGSDVVIATPGRLIAHLASSGVDLSHVSYFILDEADRMLDMGFSADIMQIASYLPKQRQTIMFSATLPPKIRELARQILTDPAEVNIAVSKPNEAIRQSAYVCYEHQKTGLIKSLFRQPVDGKTIIFSSSKQKVKNLAYTLRKQGLGAAAMHSDLDQEQREAVMLDFKNGKISLLVATDIVARGIDIEDIGLVINYDVPRDPEDYIHRIGRTARADADGAAITFVNEEDQPRFRRIERFIERDIDKMPLPEGVGEGPVYEPDKRRGRGGSGGRKEGGRGDASRRDASRKPRGERKARRAPRPERPAGENPAGPQAAVSAEGKKEGAPHRRRNRHGRRRNGKPSGEGSAPEVTPQAAPEKGEA